VNESHVNIFILQTTVQSVGLWLGTELCSFAALCPIHFSSMYVGKTESQNVIFGINVCCYLPIAWCLPCTRWVGILLYICCYVVACRRIDILLNTTEATVSVLSSTLSLKSNPIESKECGTNFTRFLIW